ncbi:MAG: DUF2336 domain-containing protein [Alphaproteobacteria bacterium]|nr:DUF2336 domain-containing protein [Alphaproteobacteria bacterium SS10]
MTERQAPPSGIHLTEADVDKLTEDKSAATRSDVAAKLGQELDSGLSDGERAIAEDIVRSLAHDVAVTVRQALSESLKNSPNLPDDVAQTLARDVEEVALPILQYTPTLSDEELIGIVNSGSESKQTAVAQRMHLSEDVSSALVSTGAETAVAELMRNATAQINAKGYDTALNRFPDSDQVHGSILQRQNTLPGNITERLVSMVSDQLLDYLVQREDVPDEVAADMLLRTRQRATMNLFGDDDQQNNLNNLVKTLDEAGHLSGSLILRSLCMGDLDFFEAALAHMSGLPIVNSRLLIYDEGPLGLKTIYERSEVALSLLPATRAALNVVRETLFDGAEGDIERRRRRVLERVLTQVDALNDDDLDYLIAKLDSLAPVDFLAEARALAGEPAMQPA